MKKLYFIGICLCMITISSYRLNGQTQTVGLFSHLSGSEDDGYVLFTPFTSDSTYLIDKCGRLAHKWGSNYHPGLDVYLLPDGTLLRTGHYPNAIFDPSNGSDGGIIERYDWSGNLLWHYIISDSTQTQNHDIYYMPNGNILVAIWEVISDSEAIAKGRDPSLLGTDNLWSAKITEIKPIGTDSGVVVWKWRLWDHLIQDFDSTKLNYGVVADHPELLNLNYFNSLVLGSASPDWTHLNAVTYNPALNQVMISAHNIGEIWIIDHSTDSATAASHTGGIYHKGGDFLYRWGNPSVYNRGTFSDMKLFQQHDPIWLTSGKYTNQIMIFNNGLGRPGGSASSVDIINPPIDSLGNYTLAAGTAFGPANLTWTYQDTIPGNFFSAYMGGAMPLPNGNTLICDAMEGHFFEIDSLKNTVWDYINPVQDGVSLSQGASVTYFHNAAYRCTFYPSSYSAFLNENVMPGQYPIEQNPLPYSCTLSTGVVPIAVKDNSLSIFPNPADNLINIKTDNLHSASLMDLSGRIIVNGNYDNVNHVSLNTASLSDGIYIICVNGQQYQKVVIEH